MKPVFLSIVCNSLVVISSTAQSVHPEEGLVTDIDGNVYKTVKIGSSIWMAENLKVSRYLNGELIPFVADSQSWESLFSGTSCSYNNDKALGKIYGKLYNWYAASDPRGLCPEGWHIPTKIEFQNLADHLGGDTIAGEKLKSPASGFAALSAGFRFFNGKYKHFGNFTGWWSSTEANTDFGWVSILNFKNDPELYLKFLGKKNGFSCRCVKN